MSAGHDTINTTIKRITGLRSKIDNLLKLAVWWVVVQLILNKLRPKVLNQLEGEMHSRRSNDSTVEIRPNLNLAPSFTAPSEHPS